MDQDQKNTLLIFQVGPYSFCVSALEVESIISPPPITTIPFAPKSVAGTCLFHEKVALVINLHQKFGLKRDFNTDSDQLIVTNLQSGLAAFRVDAVNDVTTSTDLQWEKISAAQSNSVFDHFLLKDGLVILHTNFETLYSLPDSKHVDDALKSLASLGAKPETDNQERSADTSAGIAENKQLKSEVAIDVLDQEDTLLEKSSPESLPADIFDFETIPSAQENLTGPPPGSINYSVDEHDAFDINHMRKSTENKAAGNKSPKALFPKFEKKTPGFSRKIKAGPFNQERVNSHTPRKTSMTGWIFLVALLLAFAGAFFLWPSGPEQKKEAYPKETYQIVAEKYGPSETSESDDALNQPYQAKKDNKIEDATAVEAPPPYMASTEEEIIIHPLPETENAFIKAENTLEQTDEPGPEFIAKQTIDGPTMFAEPEVVGPEDIVPEEKPEPFKDRNKKGEIYRLENKDFALIVERPLKKEIAVIDGASKKKLMFQEYVHIVIKGDTLWAIASKYLGDPFLYNQLAENSEIKNPDLIYPGDRVRIIKKRHNR